MIIETSIVMPFKNSSLTIEDSILSVINQTYKVFELLLINDYADYESGLIAEKFSILDNRVKIIKSNRQGLSFARNLGIKNAVGRYLCFLDSDDLLTRRSIETRVDFHKKTGAPISHGNYLRLKNNRITKVCVKENVNKADMLKFNYIGNLAGMYDTLLLKKELQIDVRHEDYLMWFKLVEQAGKSVRCSHYPLGIYRVSSNSLSSNKFKAFIWHFNILNNHLCSNIFEVLYYQMNYVFKSLHIRLMQSQPLTKNINMY